MSQATSGTRRGDDVFDCMTPLDASEGRLNPVRTDRQIARRVAEHRRIRRVAWWGRTARLAVQAHNGTSVDRFLLDDIRTIVDEVAPPTYEVEYDADRDKVFIRNTVRGEGR